MDKHLIDDELVPVYETNEGNKIVDARELHEFLQVGRDFTSWIQERVKKYGFVENVDFTVTLTKTGERQNVTRHDYSLALDMAKELAMVENNERGSQARKHFIEIEKRFKQQSIDISKLNPQMQMFHHMFQATAQLELSLKDAQKQLAQVSETVDAMQETFLQRDEDWRNQMNGLIKGVAYRTGIEHREIWTRSYQLLEERAKCDLDARLRNLRKRLEDAGATKTQIKEANRMDAIESDARLKEIYSTIAKELSLGSLRVLKGESANG